VSAVFRGKRLRLDYPCAWQYKVVGEDESALRQAIGGTLKGRSHTVTLSNRSRMGRYVCLNVELVVLNEGDRKDLFEALREIPGVKTIL